MAAAGHLKTVILHCVHGKGGLTRPRVGGSVYALALKINVAQICLFVVISEVCPSPEHIDL